MFVVNMCLKCINFFFSRVKTYLNSQVFKNLWNTRGSNTMEGGSTGNNSQNSSGNNTTSSNNSQHINSMLNGVDRRSHSLDTRLHKGFF